MLPNDYQKAALRTECNQEAARTRMADKDYRDDARVLHPLLAIRLNHAVIGLAGEVGELASLIERWIHYGKPLDLAKIKDEAGDTLWYLALLLDAAGFTMEETMEANLRKLLARFPDRYSDERADPDRRDREAERRAVLTEDNPRGAMEQSRRKPNPRRTRSEVLRLREHGVMGGCCDNFANHSPCNCLEEAIPDISSQEAMLRSGFKRPSPADSSEEVHGFVPASGSPGIYSDPNFQCQHRWKEDYMEGGVTRLRCRNCGAVE